LGTANPITNIFQANHVSTDTLTIELIHVTPCLEEQQSTSI